MKTISIAILLPFIALTSGCSSVGTNLANFVAKLPPNEVVDVTQTTLTPVYSHTESVTAMSKAADGTITISNAKAWASIPEIGVSWSLSVSGLRISPASVPAK